MRNNMDEINRKLDKLDSRLDKIDTTLVQQSESLKHHIYRTDLLESKTDKIVSELEPIERCVHAVDGGMKLMGLLSLVAAILSFIFKLTGIL